MSSDAILDQHQACLPTRKWVTSAMAALSVAALMTTSFMLPAASAAAAKLEKKKMNIQQVTSSGGIKAWLVEEHSIPLIALRFAFAGGSSQDPVGKEGVAHFLTAMMDEGAGDMEAAQFQERAEEIAMRMSFSQGRDAFYGSFQTLSENRDAATDLLRLAITKPRFDSTAVERIRKQLVTSLSFAKKDPNQVASKAWSKLAFPDHTYGRPSKGSSVTVGAISSADLHAFHKRIFAKSDLIVAVVGDIDAKALGAMLDKIFGDLGDKGDLVDVVDTKPAAGTVKVIEMPVPQSVAIFGSQGISRPDPDFVPAYVMNHILGGGGFASRLVQKVREKRGFAYSVHSYLQPFDHAAVFAGSVATKNEKLVESLDVIREQIKKMVEEGPSQQDLDNAKSYLTGSYALRFDTSGKIASQLLGIQQNDLGIDYVDTRNDLINAVTLDDLKRVAKRILKPENLIISVAGQPQGLKSDH